MEKITVVVPAYNTAPWLKRSLDSLMGQTYENLEVIVVNDGSKDDTVAVLDAYCAANPRVRAIHKENGGVTSARLRGVAEATGDWIAFMDGDDYVEPQMYGRLLELAKQYQADIAHCGHRIVFSDGRQELVHHTGKLYQQDHRQGLRDLLDNNAVSLSLCTKLYKKGLFPGLEDWMDTSIKNNEDLLMNYYLFGRANSAIFEGNCPYHYILRQGSASYSGITENFYFDPIRVRYLLLERVEPEMKDDVRQSLIRNILFNYAMLTVHAERKNLGQYRSRVRNYLLEHQDYFHLLSTRNRVLAKMICKAPWTFHITYRIYDAIFQREETH